MRPNKKLLFSIIAGAAVGIVGCSDEKDSPIEDLTIVEEGTVKPLQNAISTKPTAILGGGGSMSALLSQTFTNIVEPAQAKHVVVAFADMDTFEAEITAAYQRGNLITVVDPDGTALEEWCAARGIVFTGDPATADISSLISFNRKAASMAVQKKERGHEEEEIEEDLVPMLAYTGWIDKIISTSLQGADFRSRDIRKRVSPQRVSHIFHIEIPAEEVSKTGWGLPGNASLNTIAELSCDIHPLHSFAGNATFTGDFYAVEAELTIHSSNLYNGRWQYSQGDRRYESCGFLLSGCGLGMSLYERTEAGLLPSATHMLAGGPAPASTAFASPCQSGFEWTFDGWLSGGSGLESTTPIPLQEGGWTWNNLAEGTETGADILTETDGGDVKWSLTVGDLPADRADAVPASASGDLTFRCSWIWGVPQATDDSTGRYYMQIELSPVYCWMRSLLSGGRLEWNKTAPAVPSARFMLAPPSRVEGQRL